MVLHQLLCTLLMCRADVLEEFGCHPEVSALELCG